MTSPKLTKRKKSTGLFLILFLLLSFSACDKDEVYYRYHDIKNMEWSKLDTLYFDIDSAVIDTETDYHMSIQVSHTFDYPYRNIWFYMHENITDTLYTAHGKQFMLADEFGNWYGSGFGSLYQYGLEYFDSVRFKEKRNYRIKLVHGMRDEPLDGIEKVGIKIIKKQKQDN